MKRTLIFCVLSLACYFSISVARAEVSSPRVYIERVGSFGAKIFIDTAVPVNAYNVSIRYNPAIVEVDRVNTSESLITITPRPFSFGGGAIMLRGGSTNSFSGERGVLAELSLRPVGKGVVVFDVVEAIAYTADGTGNPIALAHESVPLRVTADSFGAYDNAREQLAIVDADVVPPVLIDIRVAENPLAQSGRLIVFAATDKDSGVARYEARDREWLSWSSWREAVNPYPVESGAWSVQLKAIDNDGNATLATVYNAGPALYKGLGLLTLAWLVLRGVRFLVRRRLLQS
jgi:hypothetical protein